MGIAADVRARRVTARETTAVALARIRARDPGLYCFSAVLEEDALHDAAAVDAALAAGRDPGPLAGVPFAVKNLFAVRGLVTLAGSKINAGHAPASRDATVVGRLRGAGAVLLGALNMDEYAFGFTTENSHYGPTRNPHDSARVAEAPRVGRRRPWRAASCRSPSARTPTARSASPPRCAASTGSSPPMAGSLAQAQRSSASASTTWARSPPPCAISPPPTT